MPPAVPAMLAEFRKLAWLVGVLWVGPAWAVTYTAKVRWRPSPDASVIGYHVHTRTIAGIYGPSLDAGNPILAADGTMSFLVSGLDAAVGHAFMVTAYASNGSESPFSNELTLPQLTISSTSTTTTTHGPTTTSTTASTSTTSTTRTSTTSTTARTSTTITNRPRRKRKTTTTTTMPVARATATSRASTPTPPASCRPAPQTGCQPAAPQRAAILLAKGRLTWRWAGRAAVAASDFGDPATTTSYLLCIYDALGRESSAQAPAGGLCRGRPCWRQLGWVGFRYGDRDALPDGLVKISLAAGGPGRARIQVAAGTPNLHLPTLPFATPVLVQMQQTDGSGCWEATYTTGVTNTTGEFKAKSD